MPFNKYPDPIGGGEIEIFEGYVDFVKIKQKDAPDRYGKTHSVSVCVDGADGANGTWLSFPAVEENRIRDEGKAVGVQSDGKWYNLCKGFKIRVAVSRNGDWINPQMKTLKVLEEPSQEQKAEASKPAASKSKSGFKKDTLGQQIGHSLKGASELSKRFDMDYNEAMFFYHDVTREVINYNREHNTFNLDEYSLGMSGGNAVNAALTMIESPDDLQQYAIGILNKKVPLLRNYIETGSKTLEAAQEVPQPKEEPVADPQPAKAEEPKQEDPPF